MGKNVIFSTKEPAHLGQMDNLADTPGLWEHIDEQDIEEFVQVSRRESYQFLFTLFRLALCHPRILSIY